jgi:hypothetical protein
MKSGGDQPREKNKIRNAFVPLGDEQKRKESRKKRSDVG